MRRWGLHLRVPPFAHLLLLRLPPQHSCQHFPIHDNCATTTKTRENSTRLTGGGLCLRGIGR
ncbi:hypothetical protein KC19_2G237100 [Ceratodon purpureus]|uniref:Secreted protein n=1 Tax=Ceratodon purpureus TaxID=3225 RepID=A0A8T0IZF3_CERPU|nr:hypothetical protein KC19_2G237100 [Ceratodon purpureus]